MNVVDSSAWLEYFAGGPNAEDFTPAIMSSEALVVPSITLFEGLAGGEYRAHQA